MSIQEAAYRSDTSPDLVLAALRRAVPYWRESEIPVELRGFGRAGVGIAVSGRTFRIFRNSNRRPPISLLELRGSVSDDGNGGSIIRVSPRVPRAWWYGPIMFGGFALFAEPGWEKWVVVFVALALVGYGVLLERPPIHDNPELNHFIERFENAMADIGATAHLATNDEHGSVRSTDIADVSIYWLPTVESGRTEPVYLEPQGSSSYRPHFRIGPSGDYLGVSFLSGTPRVANPGDDSEASVALIYVATGVDYSALVPGTKFEVLEGRQVVGRGVVNARRGRQQSAG